MGSVLGGGGDSGAEDAANIQADAQREALAYLKQREKLPQAFREGALKDLGAEYGLTLDEKGNIISDGRSVLDRAEASPFYSTAVRRGEDAVLRNASATGGLRSGNTNEALAEVNTNALLNAYNQQLSGLQGFASLPSNANNIAASMAGIGQTMAQGQIAEANYQNASQQNQMNNLTGLASLGLTAASFFSDRRLKSEIRYVGEENGHRKYTWVWNSLAEKLGLHGQGSGVMADEVELTNPHAVYMRDGFKVVDYSALGVSHGV